MSSWGCLLVKKGKPWKKKVEDVSLDHATTEGEIKKNEFLD